MLVDKLVDNYISADMIDPRESQDHDGLIRVIDDLKMDDLTIEGGIEIISIPLSNRIIPGICMSKLSTSFQVRWG